MKKFLMEIKLVGNNRKKKIHTKFIQILPAPTEDTTENIGEDIHY